MIKGHIVSSMITTFTPRGFRHLLLEIGHVAWRILALNFLIMGLHSIALIFTNRDW